MALELTTSWKEEGLQEGFAIGMQQGVQQGVQQGIRQGQEYLVVRQLTRRVGMLLPDLEAQVRGLPMEELDALGDALLDFTNRDDLIAWLSARSV